MGDDFVVVAMSEERGLDREGFRVSTGTRWRVYFSPLVCDRNQFRTAMPHGLLRAGAFGGPEGGGGAGVAMAQGWVNVMFGPFISPSVG